ncbi:MAG: hypothetical protein JNJ54_32535 [Myxococcaceae bacterium]|nr:hypothetical protein [Myxococcaceae bacterium]
MRRPVVQAAADLAGHPVRLERGQAEVEDRQLHARGDAAEPVARLCAVTSVARSLFAVSAALRSQLASRPLGPLQRTLWLSAPARSTNCGARSRQLLSLVTPSSELPCGWLDVVNARCALAPWPALVATQRARESASLELTRDEYVAFACWLAELLAPMRIRVNWACR